jgi:hypothetical protein
LGVEAGGEVVAVAHEFGVVEEDHAGFERHGLFLVGCFGGDYGAVFSGW